MINRISLGLILFVIVANTTFISDKKSFPVKSFHKIIGELFWNCRIITTKLPDIKVTNEHIEKFTDREKQVPLSEKMQEALDKFDAAFDEIFKWWGEMYDPQSRGFYYSLSSKNNIRYVLFKNIHKFNRIV